MKDFNKSDIPALDFIIDQCLKTGFSVNANDLVDSGHIKLTDEKGYSSLTTEFDVTQEFTRYLGILDKYKVCECSFAEDAEFASSNSRTFNFQKQGGFKALYKDLKEQRKRDKLDFKKTKTDLKLAKKTLNEFPRTKFLAWGGFIIGVLLLLKELYIAIYK
ncbi:hypothetical protein [Confluentibacter lentus]|uniref:hypothetical protein n=1 Tax=Confluentibacter lentus TaxID=1699412 RepID=UPI000C2914A7|nr:hypothetical protein [Confluentibacter lentus]